MSYRNKNGSTGYVSKGKFVAFESQEEADKSRETAEATEPAKKPAAKKTEAKKEEE